MRDLHQEIRKFAQSVEERGDGIEMVLIRMDAIQHAVLLFTRHKHRALELRWKKKLEKHIDAAHRKEARRRS